MRHSRCEKEIQTVIAVRTDALTAELKEHLQSCADCAETAQVARTLLQYAAAVCEDQRSPTAGRIWRQAQVRKQELALKRAMRPLIFMRALSGMGVIGLVTWLLHRFSSWDYRGLERGWSMTGDLMAAIGMGIAILCVAMGAWYLLYEDKRNDSIISSM